MRLVKSNTDDVQPAEARVSMVPPARRLRRALKQLLPAGAREGLERAWVRGQIKAVSLLGDPLQLRRPVTAHQCPICGYEGRFWSFGEMPRSEALCPQCFSLERHRLFQLLLDQGAADVLAGRRILHFAPEGFIRPLLEQMAQCVTTDVAGGGISCRSSMEALPFPDASFDAVIANHVLEHIADDRLAMREIRRVLRPDGLAILSVPLVQGWARTYEDRRISEPGARRVHFGQDDHLRYYGRDFVDRLRQGGFAVDVFQLDHRREIKYGLQRGEQMFIARPLPGSGGRKIRSPIPAAADD